MPVSIDKFMAALSGQESGGSYDAKNGRTGAYGRFQILPSNWPSWSREAGIPGAEQTPENQEKVAKYKLQQYYDKFGNWGDVAAAWYSGAPTTSYTAAQLDRKQGNGNEPSIREYVNSVLSRASHGTGPNGSSTAEFINGVDSADGMEPIPTTPNGYKPKYEPAVNGHASLGSMLYNMGPGRGGSSPTAFATSDVDSVSTYKPGAKKPAGYQRTGDYKSDTLGWVSAMTAANDQLQKYIQSAPYAVRLDENKGLVYKVQPGVGTDQDGNPTEVETVDIGATKIYQDYINASQNFDQLLGLKKAGLVDGGEGAAAAYLASEKDKAAEATRQYDDFVKRIGDVVSLENVPITRAQTLASTLASIYTGKKNRVGTYDQYATLPDGKQPMDLSPFVSSIKGTIPGQAPSPYSINPDALKPAPSASTSIPVPKPEEVLARYGITLPGGSTSLAMPGGVNPHDYVQDTPPASQPGGQPQPVGAGPVDLSAYDHTQGSGSSSFDDLLTSLAGALGFDTKTKKKVPDRTYGSSY